MLIAVEAALTCLAVVGSFLLSRQLVAAFAPVERLGHRLASSPAVAVLTVIMAAALLRAALLPLVGIPVPQVQDEFSLLLQAETFSQLRVVAPEHPMWRFFETIHVNVTPVHASIYFPGRSAPLVIGLWIANEPWLGVWATMVALAGAVTWMLLCCVRLPYALLGGLLVVFRFGLFSYWINSYWGGAFPALGGVLVLGATLRLMREPRWRDGLILGVGLLILITSRPFEGALFCLPFAAVIAVRLFARIRQGDAAAVARMSVLPALGVILGVAALGGYNEATTGDAFKTAYSANRERYGIAPAFLTAERLQPFGLQQESLRNFYEREAVPHNRRETARGIFKALRTKLRALWRFYAGPALTLPFLIGAIVLARTRPVPIIAGGLVVAGYVLTTWDFPHYAAPALGVVMLCAVAGLERLRGWRWRDRPIGHALSRSLPLAMGAPLLVPLLGLSTGLIAVPVNFWNATCCALGEQTDRSTIVAALQAQPGRDLIIVRYRFRGHNYSEWVYNAPDPDEAAIVWAREPGQGQVAGLRSYYGDRRHWLVEVSDEGARISPLPPVEQQGQGL